MVSALRYTDLFRSDSLATSVRASALASLAARVVGLFRGIALAWFIPQAEFGRFGVALLIANLLLPICTAGLYEGVARYTPYHEAIGKLRRFVFTSAGLLLVIALPAGAMLALCAEPIGAVFFSGSTLAGAANGDGAAGRLMRATLACVVALAGYQTLLGYLRGLRMFRAISAAEVLTAALFTALALLVAGAGFASAQALILSYAVSCVVVTLLFVPGFTRAALGFAAPPRTAPRRPRSGLVIYSAWAAAAAVLWHALSYYPMWYLLKVSGEATVGTFHGMRLVTQLTQLAAAMLTAVVSANLTRLWERNGPEATRVRLAALTKATLLLLLVIATSLTLLRPVMVAIFPAAFAVGKAAYDPLVLFFLLVGAVGLIAVRLNLAEKPRLVCLAWLIGALVNVVASFALLGTAAGTEGDALAAAAWAGVIGAATALFVCAVLAARERLRLDGSTVVLLVAGVSVTLGWTVALPTGLLLTAVAFGTSWIFSPGERAELRIETLTTVD